MMGTSHSIPSGQFCDSCTSSANELDTGVCAPVASGMCMLGLVVACGTLRFHLARFLAGQGTQLSQ